MKVDVYPAGGRLYRFIEEVFSTNAA